MTKLTNAVGVRNGVTQAANAPADQGKVIELLWRIDPGNGGMKGVTSAPVAGSPKNCRPELAVAIAAFQAFWLARGEFRVADGVVDPLGRTLAKLDAVAGGAAPPPAAPALVFTDLKVLRFQQTLPAQSASLAFPSIIPQSVMPFLFAPVAKNSMLAEAPAVGSVFEFLFKIEKNGATFWVGACVPAATTDFSSAYIYFHPDTITPTDDANYRGFTGRWPNVRRYVLSIGLQMAQIKAMPLIVPFMTNSSRANTAKTNLFADLGVETLDDILSAIQISMGRTAAPGSVQRVGVASFSSGVDHLFRFAQKLGTTGVIREQIDFDSPFMIVAHKNAPVLAGAVNWVVSQNPPSFARALGWLHLPSSAFAKINTLRNDTHSQIGFMMFQTMMILSAIR